MRPELWQRGMPPEGWTHGTLKPSLQVNLFTALSCRQVIRSDARHRDDILVDGPYSALFNCAYGQFRLERYSELSYRGHVERHRDLVGNREPTPGSPSTAVS